MISTKDLRIGNKVSIHTGFELDVVGIYQNDVLLNFKENEGDAWEEQEKYIFPIDITDEIISTWWSNRKGRKTDDLELSMYTTGKLYLSFNGSYHMKCDYLHQLQNTYYILTGNELKYKKAKGENIQ